MYNNQWFCDKCFTPTGRSQSFRSEETYDKHMQCHQYDDRPTPMTDAVETLNNRLDEMFEEIKMLRLTNVQAQDLHQEPKPMQLTVNKPMKVIEKKKKKKQDEVEYNKKISDDTTTKDEKKKKKKKD